MATKYNNLKVIIGDHHKKTVYNKLVRDKIPEIIAKQGKSVSFHSLQGDEVKAVLKNKLIEETYELVNAESKKQVIEEAVDIMEVLEFLLFCYDTNLISIQDKRASKAKEKGVFWNAYFLESVEEKQ